MSIDTSKVTALSDEKGVIVQIADAAGNVLWSAAPALINFTIAGNAYQAEEGMTWVEWCDSEYCPMMNAYQKAFFTYGNDQYVQASDATGNVQYNGRFVYGGDTLIDGASYTKYFEVGGWD